MDRMDRLIGAAERNRMDRLERFLDKERREERVVLDGLITFTLHVRRLIDTAEVDGWNPESWTELVGERDRLDQTLALNDGALAKRVRRRSSAI